MNITVCNHAKDTRMTPDLLLRYANAWTNQLVDFCAAYGKAPVEVRVGDDSSEGWKLRIFDDSDVANALGYHSRGPDGQPYSAVFTAGMDPLVGADSVPCVGSHESCEITLDPLCNLWFEDSIRRKFAGEACDAVQRRTYNDIKTGLPVSNFVTPNYWNTLYTGKNVDWLGVLTRPFEIDPDGGYSAVTLENGTRILLPEEMKASLATNPKKQHPSSRTYRRLVGHATCD